MSMTPVYLTVVALLAVMIAAWAWARVKTRDGTLSVRHFAFTRRHLSILKEQVPFYSRLPVELRDLLQDRMIHFMDGKKWKACGGLDAMTDEMKVIISANACLLFLRRDGEPNLDRILGVHVYPATPIPGGDAPPPLDEWPSATVLMVWDSVKKTARDMRDAADTAVGDYAREIDPGTTGSSLSHAGWARVMSNQWIGVTPPDPSASDKSPPKRPAEYFAALTEAFFEWPQRLLAKHPDIYAALRTFYQMDPSRWRQAR